MTPDEMKGRTRTFALRCLKLADSFPKSASGQVIARQLIKAATSVAANYHSACIARSHPTFVSRLSTSEEECDESVFWIEFSVHAGLTTPQRVEGLCAEGKEILAILVQSCKTAKGRSKRPSSSKR